MVHRQTRLHGTIQSIREAASQKGYTFRTILVLNPDPSALQSKVQVLSERVKYDKTGYEELDAASSVLNLEEISNYEKHREVWRRMQTEVVPTASSSDICLIIEDDTIIIPEFTKNFEAFLDNPRIKDWDLYLMGVATSVNSDTGRMLMPVADLMRTIPSKCAYAVRPTSSALQTLLDETEVIRFNMRIQLSYIFQKRRDLRAIISTRQCFMEGSKVGLFPSTLHSNNLLIFNQEYMDLFRMLQSNQINEATASALYERVKHIQSPDLLHIYGVLLFKCGKVNEAAQHLKTAVEWTQVQHGFLSPQSELLNNLINMHEHMQWDLPQYLSTPSKYDA